MTDKRIRSSSLGGGDLIVIKTEIALSAMPYNYLIKIKLTKYYSPSSELNWGGSLQCHPRATLHNARNKMRERAAGPGCKISGRRGSPVRGHRGAFNSLMSYYIVCFKSAPYISIIN